MDGSFERINSSMLKTTPQAGQVISLVGKVLDCDGVSTATIEAADGGRVTVEQVDPNSFPAPNAICEIMGSPTGETAIQVSKYYYLCFRPYYHLHLTISDTSNHMSVLWYM